MTAETPSTAASSGLPADLKIERHCPRCRAHHYHCYWQQKKVAVCTACGHWWKARIFRVKDLGETAK